MLALANLPVRKGCIAAASTSWGHQPVTGRPAGTSSALQGALGDPARRLPASAGAPRTLLTGEDAHLAAHSSHFGRTRRHSPSRRLRPCPAPLWPVKAPLPAAGALLPFHRIVAYYGNFYSTHMGILGADPPEKVLALLKTQADAWARAAPETPVTPALDYIAVAAQNNPGRDHMYRLRMPASQIEKALGMADQIHGLLILDVQPGWSTVQIEVPLLAPYLKLPNVELALDPEFNLPPGGKRPGLKRGTMSAADINFAARFLARLVEQYHLPPKILVVHRFTQRMVSDYRSIRPLPQVQIVMDMDGFGSPSLKIGTYRSFIASQPVQFTGFKLFYYNDVHYGHRLMTPRQVLALSPRPIYIVYQ